MKSILCLLTLLISFSAEAINIVKSFEQGGSDRGGGDGIYIDGKLYLLDLVEVGADQAPGRSDYQHPMIADAYERAAADLELKPATLAILNSMLHQYGRYHEHGAYMFAALLAIRNLNWALVNVDLRDVQDEDTEVLCQDNCVQLAVRRDDTIFVSKKKFEELNSVHQAALIIHEALYYLLDQGSLASSREIRQVVGFLFKTTLATSPNAYMYYWRNGKAKLLFDKTFGTRFEITPGSLIGTRKDIANYFHLSSPYFVVKVESANGSTGFVMRKDWLYSNEIQFPESVICSIGEATKVTLTPFLDEISWWNQLEIDTVGMTIDGKKEHIFEGTFTDFQQCVDTLVKSVRTFADDTFNAYDSF